MSRRTEASAGTGSTRGLVSPSPSSPSRGPNLSFGSKLCPCGSEMATAGLGHTLSYHNIQRKRKSLFQEFPEETCSGEEILIHLSWPLRPLLGTCLVAQWLWICLPVQGTWVQFLVWEDHMCRGAIMPEQHNDRPRACAPSTREATAVRRLCTPARDPPPPKAARDSPCAATNKWIPTFKKKKRLSWVSHSWIRCS